MFAFIPFLIGPLSMGVISLIIFLGSMMVIPIPALATRGTTQAIWAGLAALALLVEAAILVTLTVLVSNGTIWQ